MYGLSTTERSQMFQAPTVPSRGRANNLALSTIAQPNEAIGQRLDSLFGSAPFGLGGFPDQAGAGNQGIFGQLPGNFGQGEPIDGDHGGMDAQFGQLIEQIIGPIIMQILSRLQGNNGEETDGLLDGLQDEFDRGGNDPLADSAEVARILSVDPVEEMVSLFLVYLVETYSVKLTLIYWTYSTRLPSKWFCMLRLWTGSIFIYSFYV